MQMSSEIVAGSVVKRVHLAWDTLLSGDIDLAIMLLQGVEPEARAYATYYVVLGSALLSKQQNEAALSAASTALELTPGSPHAILIRDLSRERIGRPIEDLDNNVGTTGGHAQVEERVQIEPRTRVTLAALLDPLRETAQIPQFDIDRTADELTRERPLVRPVPEPEHIQPTPLPDQEDAPALVSETLAEIMIRQGKLSDAKKVYIQLARQQPEKYAHFKTKIEAIDKLLLGTSIAPETTTSETTDNHPVG